MLARVWVTRILLVGMDNGTDALEKSETVSHETKHALTIWPDNSTLGHLREKNGNSCSHKNLYTDIPNSLTHNVLKQEPTEMSLGG